MLKNNQEIWIYDCPCYPKRGVVIEKMDGIDAYKVRMKDQNISQCRIYGRHRLFKYPEEKNKIICEMKDDAFYLDKKAKEFELSEL
jgi:hypothetical protein